MKRIALILSLLIVFGLNMAFADHATTPKRFDGKMLPRDMRETNKTQNQTILGETVIFMEDFESGAEGWFMDGGYASDGGLPTVTLHPSTWEISEAKSNSPTHSLFHPDEVDGSRDFVFSAPFTVPEEIDGDPVVSAKLSFMLNIDNPGYGDPNNPGYLGDYFMVWAGLEETTFSVIDDGGNMVYFSGYPEANSFQYLTSPAIDLTAATAPVKLTFDAKVINEIHWDLGRVDILVDGEQGYQTVAVLDSNGMYDSFDIDISDQVGKTVQVRFSFLPDYGSAVEGGGLWVDNIKVTDATGDLFMDDAETGNAVMVPFGITLARLFYDYDRVGDGGVSWNLWDESVLFNGTADLFDLGIMPGDKVWLALNYLTDGDNTQGEEASAGAFFDDFVVTAISGVPADAGVSDLIVGYPQTAGLQSVAAATVSNFGFEAQSVPLWYKVGDAAEMPVPPYLDMEPFADTTRVFDIQLPEGDSTDVMAMTKLPNDMVPENDAMASRVYMDPPGVITLNYSKSSFSYYWPGTNTINLYNPLSLLEDVDAYNVDSILMYFYDPSGAEDQVQVTVATWSDDPLTPVDILVDSTVTVAGSGVVPIMLPVGATGVTDPIAVWVNTDNSNGSVGLLSDDGTPFAGNDLYFDTDDQSWYVLPYGLFCYGQFSYATAPPPPPLPPVVRAAVPPAIDGELDPIWEHTPWVREFGYPSGGEGTTFTDAALSWRAMYDDDYLYLYIQVMDDIFLAEDGVDWHGDSIELWLDGDNSKGTEYDGVNDLGYNFYYTNDPENPLIFKKGNEWRMGTTNTLQGAAFREGGVSLELAIPLENLGIDMPMAGQLIGMDVDYNDNDIENGERETKVKWFDQTDNSWNNPSLMGTIELVDRTVYPFTDVWYLNEPPMIDGEMDPVIMDLPTFHLNHYMNTTDSLNSWWDIALDYKVAWDSTYLYYFVKVTDDVLLNEGAYNWTDDGLELWFNGDNGKETAYDGVNDMGLFFGVGNEGKVDSMYFHTISAGHVTFDPASVMWASSPVDGGFFLEFAMPLDSIGVMPKNGWTFGHEIDYNDSDTPGLDRDTKCKTFWESDDTWGNPSAVGPAKLMGGPGEPMMPQEPMLAIDATMAPPVIDGQWEPIWENARAIEMDKFAEGEADNWWDSYGIFRILYDKDNLYMFVAINDDTIDVSNETDYQRDSIELYFDGDNSKNALEEGEDPWAWPPVNYDENDAQLRFVYGSAPISSIGTYDVSDIEYAYSETETGWTLEFAMPLDGKPIEAKPGNVIGFDIYAADNDGTGDRESIISWWNQDNENWHDPSGFGTAVFTDRAINDENFGRLLPIPFTPYPIKVDAEPDYAWSQVAPVFGNHRFNATDSLSSPMDAATHWKAAWDYDYLYLMVHVTDDILLQEGNYNWKDDGIEMWWDGDASLLESYTDANDLSFAWAYDPEAVLTPMSNWRGALDSLSMTKFVQAQKLVDDGLVLEMAMPWSVLGTDVGDGALVGIEVDYNDSDTPGLDRDTKIKSYDPTDNTWQNPSLMGLARLVGSKIESDVEENVEVVTTYELHQNYPNPFNPSTHIDFALPVDGQVKLVIYDVLGREVVTLLDQKMNSGKHSVTFDASQYASGVYFYSLQTSEQTITKKMMLLK